MNCVIPWGRFAPLREYFINIFTYALVLANFYRIPDDRVGWYLLLLALGSFIGPVVLGTLFDVIGRRVRIAYTYSISGVLLAIYG